MKNLLFVIDLYPWGITVGDKFSTRPKGELILSKPMLLFSRRASYVHVSATLFLILFLFMLLLLLLFLFVRSFVPRSKI